MDKPSLGVSAKLMACRAGRHRRRVVEGVEEPVHLWVVEALFAHRDEGNAAQLVRYLWGDVKQKSWFGPEYWSVRRRRQLPPCHGSASTRPTGRHSKACRPSSR